jgi:hypothetical protein
MIADPIKRFELWFLRPLWGMTILVILAAAINSRWWWVVGGVLSILYTGVIGAKLHPTLSVCRFHVMPGHDFHVMSGRYSTACRATVPRQAGPVRER